MKNKELREKVVVVVKLSVWSFESRSESIANRHAERIEASPLIISISGEWRMMNVGVLKG